MRRIIRSVYNFVTDLHLLPFGKDSILNNNYSDDQPLVRLGQGDYEREIWYSAHDKTGVSPEVDDLKVAAEEGRIVTDSLETILATVRGTFPEAEIADNSDGQVIIYTGLYQVGDSSTPLVSSEDLFLRRAAMLEGELDQ